MICWSCERAAGGGPQCESCGAILPPDAKADHFAVFGLERRYDIDAADLEARYRERSRKLHPDRFATADARARRASLAHGVQMNEARGVLKDPIRRAEYLLGLDGVLVPKEAPPALLMEILELREELGDARAAGRHDEVQAMARAMRARMAAALGDIADGFAAGDGKRVADRLIELRYFRRFLDEVAVHEEAVADAG
jgi:molecular chaperone HscB